MYWVPQSRICIEYELSDHIQNGCQDNPMVTLPKTALWLLGIILNSSGMTQNVNPTITIVKEAITTYVKNSSEYSGKLQV
jgi:hypothetical protein